MITKTRTNIALFPAANTNTLANSAKQAARSVTGAFKREALFGFGRDDDRRDDDRRERDRDDDDDDDNDQNAIIIILGLDNNDDDKKKQEGKSLSSFPGPFILHPIRRTTSKQRHFSPLADEDVRQMP